MQQHRRTGCWVCWQRKLKCDSCAPNHCANCAKRGVECHYRDPSTDQELQGRTIPSRQVTEAGIPRGRAQRACSNCAAQKLKCSGDHEGCQRCAQNELVCQYLEGKRAPKQRAGSSHQVASRHARRRVRQLSAVNDQPTANEQQCQEQGSGSGAVSQKDFSIISRQTSPPQTSGLSYELRCTKDIIRRLADDYFEYVYPITTHGFLHQGTFLEELDQERTPVVLLKAIAVSASQFVTSATEATRQTVQWAHEVDVYIMNNLGTFSILNLQILIIWANHHHSNGNFGKTWMLHSLAVRLAYCLQINVDSTIGSPSEVECRRRMMWSIRILDRLLAGTVEEFSLCSRFLDNLKLPCDEHFYLAEIPVETDTLKGFGGNKQIPNIGGFAGLVRLTDIWREILLFMSRLSQDAEVGTIIPQVFALRQKLSDFEHQLPSNLKFASRNLYLHANSAQKRTFIMLQSWWHECNSMIHRFTLAGFRESVDLTSQNANFVEQCQQQVLQSALAQSNFWRSITNMGHRLLSDPTIMVLVHSNTKTLLACQKLRGRDEWKENKPPGGTNDIATLLSSNVSFLDELAKRIPMVALAQREIQNLVQKNGFQASSEATLCDGFPLKRRHSRQDLLDEKERREERAKRSQASQKMGEYRGSIRSLTDLNNMIPSADVTGPRLQEYSVTGDDAISMASMNRSNEELDFYMRTPTSLEGSASGPFEPAAHQPKARPTEVGQSLGWRNTDFGQLQQLHGGGDMANTQFLRMYEDGFIGGALGYLAPFETATQDDMLAAAGVAGTSEPQNSHDWRIQF